MCVQFRVRVREGHERVALRDEHRRVPELAVRPEREVHRRHRRLHLRLLRRLRGQALRERDRRVRQVPTSACSKRNEAVQTHSTLRACSIRIVFAV